MKLIQITPTTALNVEFIEGIRINTNGNGEFEVIVDTPSYEHITLWTNTIEEAHTEAGRLYALLTKE